MRTLIFATLVLAAAPVVAPLPAAAADMADAAFLTKAMKGDNTEIAMGMMAEKKGGTAKVRAYGQMLVHDHSAHRMKLMTLARSMGVPTTMMMSDEGKQAKSMMMGMHGAAFDSSFKQDMISDHQKDIAEYQTEATTAQSPKVRMMAQNTMPVLNKHLAAAEAL